MTVQGRDTLLCLECQQWVPHTRGFLTEHSKNIQRGALVTGASFCDGSNTKPPANLKTARFTGLCTHCVTTVKEEFRETYPGSLEQYGGVMVVNCPECGAEGTYCSGCDAKVHLEKEKVPDMSTVDPALEQAVQDMVDDLTKNGPNATATQQQYEEALTALFEAQKNAATTESDVWVNDLRESECPDGQPHQPVHRPQEDRPVLLTDNHVIVEPSDA